MTNPTPNQIRAARAESGLTQTEAAELVHAASYRTWQEWESGRRKMPAAKWELFLTKIRMLKCLTEKVPQ